MGTIHARICQRLDYQQSNADYTGARATEQHSLVGVRIPITRLHRILTNSWISSIPVADLILSNASSKFCIRSTDAWVSALSADPVLAVDCRNSCGIARRGNVYSCAAVTNTILFQQNYKEDLCFWQHLAQDISANLRCEGLVPIDITLVKLQLGRSMSTFTSRGVQGGQDRCFFQPLGNAVCPR